MADSKQKDIVDAIVSAIGGLSAVAKATQDEAAWAQAGQNLADLPIVFVNAQKPINSRAYFPHATANDMEGEMEIEIHGQTLSQYGSSKRADVDTVRQAIETGLDTDTTLQGLILDIVLTSSIIDIGSSENRGFFLDKYILTYEYNHASP